MSDAIERELCTTYSTMAEHFAAALDLLQTLHQSIERDLDTGDALARLDVLFARVALLESAAAEPRDRSPKSGTGMGRELVEALSRLDTLVRETRSRVQSAEAALLAKMEALVPALEHTHKARKMHSAYGLSIGRNAR